MLQRGVKKATWEFVCQGTFNPDLLKELLGLVYVETARGTHNFLYCFIKISRKRAEQIEKIFTEYDQEVPDGMRIKLTNLPCEPAMIGFGRGNEYANHVIYKEIKELQTKGDPSYKLWTPVLSAAQAERARFALYQQNEDVQDRVMDEDPAAFGLDDESMDDEDDDEDEAPSSVAVPIQQANPLPVPAIRQVHPSQPAFRQAAAPHQPRIESFFQRTVVEKLDKIDNGGADLNKSISASFVSISDILVENFETSHAKQDATHAKLNTIRDEFSDVKKIVVDLVEKQGEVAKLTSDRDHYEHMTFRLRGQLGSQAAQDNKPLHVEIASLKRKLEAKNKTIESRDKRFGERLERMEAGQEEMMSDIDKIIATQKVLGEKLDRILSHF